MKRFIVIFFIFFLIIVTTITKNSTKKLENRIFTVKENISVLEDKYDYTFFIESFPVIPIDTFTKMLRYAFNKTNKKLFLYHNLVHNKSYLRSFIKPKINSLISLLTKILKD